MGLEAAAILDEAAEEMRKLIQEYDSERETLELALGGDLLTAYQELIDKTVDTSESIRKQLLTLREQAMLSV